jgi:integrase
MKMKKPHAVPLSDAAVAILRAQEALRGKNPYVFPGARPLRPAPRSAQGDAQTRRWRLDPARDAQRGKIVDGRRRRRV